MLLLLSSGVQRPNRLTDNKDELYHARWARYAAYDANNFLQQQFIARTKLNKKFYKGEQWILEEDLETFFKDESGQERNRLKIIHNIIRPMVEQYRGNAIRMKINYRAKSISQKAINRREEKMNEMRLYTQIANKIKLPGIAEDMRAKLPIGKSEVETKQIFDNLWVDNYAEDINALLEYVSNLNSFEDKQLRIAEEMAFSGIAVMEAYEHNGHQYFDLARSEDYFFDRSCKEYDHSDAEYWGRQHYMNASDIYEDYQDITTDERRAIEAYATTYQKNGTTEEHMMFGGKVPVLKVYWRDTCKYEYGYVMDEFGYPYLTKINFTYEGEEKPRYTDKDLIVVDSERARRVLKGKKKANLYVDELRYCIFIPQEILSGVLNATNGDIILEYGLVPYQETDNLDVSSVKSPFKVYCWGYVDGEILSPVDDAINPQRFMNRLLSVAENQINNSRGSGTVYDKSIVDSQTGEQEMIRNMNQSKPVGVNARGRGIQNVIGSYDASINKGTMVMFDIMSMLKSQLKDVTGLNEAIQGESMGSDQLVGVTQLMIQRGSLMQEPFYNAITKVFQQCFQAIATVGKRIYADNERELAIAVGDEGARILKISQDMKMEDFRVFIKRENSEEMLVQAGNSMALTLLQLGFIDKAVYSNLYNRSTPDEVAKALRGSAKLDIEKQRMADAMAEKMQQEEKQKETDEENKQLMIMSHMQGREDNQQAMNHDNELDKIIAKGMTDQMRQSLIGNQQLVQGAQQQAGQVSAK
jgi:hypothetical protein